jgi:hypothetical protein
MFLQPRNMHADELRKRVPNDRVMPKVAWQNLCWPIPQVATTMPSAR